MGWCAYCEGPTPDRGHWPVGRPSLYCSKSCRQHAYRERHRGLTVMTTRWRANRRRARRVAAELAFVDAGRRNVHALDRAREVAWAAWPAEHEVNEALGRPLGASLQWPNYLESRAIVGDETRRRPESAAAVR